MESNAGWELKERAAAVQSVDRAITVLEHMSVHGWSGVTEISNVLGTHKSTAYRLLSTLRDRGLVEQDAETDRYRLGLGIVYLASAVTADLDILHYARPVCERLREETQGTVTVSVLTGDDVMVIYQAMPSIAVLSVDWRGKHLPLHATSDGKVMLAHLSRCRRKALLGRPLRRFTERTIVDAEVLETQLETIRRDGYGFTIEELEIGLNAVAAPIGSADGSVHATLGVSGPATRLETGSIANLGRLVIDGASEVAAGLGSGAATNGPASRSIPAS